MNSTVAESDLNSAPDSDHENGASSIAAVEAAAIEAAAAAAAAATAASEQQPSTTEPTTSVRFYELWGNFICEHIHITSELNIQD